MSRDKNKPTPAQQEWLSDVRALLEQAVKLAERGGRIARYRPGIPEHVVLGYLVGTIRAGVYYAELARAEGRPLEERHPGGGWATRYLVMGDRSAQVIPFAPYLAAKRGGARG
ncbi:hypothetical protein [Sorangium sp. So ce362]|uniref:hypothetical protein n=1 Tax=Sorangium sp. So ce362 TaxID=3133303 RepID=UPI003F61F2A1